MLSRFQQQKTSPAVVDQTADNLVRDLLDSSLVSVIDLWSTKRRSFRQEEAESKKELAKEEDKRELLKTEVSESSLTIRETR